MSQRLIYVFITLFAIISYLSCKTDKLPEPSTTVVECAMDSVTYDLKMKAIVDTYCAVSGCHVPGGDGPGDYTTYASLSPFLTKASFETSVIDLKDDPINGMPPNWDANPAPHDFTEEDYELVVCWIQNGYPEN